jgi:hypothetical protein
MCTPGDLKDYSHAGTLVLMPVNVGTYCVEADDGQNAAARSREGKKREGNYVSPTHDCVSVALNGMKHRRWFYLLLIGSIRFVVMKLAAWAALVPFLVTA